MQKHFINYKVLSKPKIRHYHFFLTILLHSLTSIHPAHDGHFYPSLPHRTLSGIWFTGPPHLKACTSGPKVLLGAEEEGL